LPHLRCVLGKQSRFLLGRHEDELAKDAASHATESSRSNVIALWHTIKQIYGKTAVRGPLLLTQNYSFPPKAVRPTSLLNEVANVVTRNCRQRSNLTTVVTFLVVFLIQNTQNRDARAIHLKLDEIIKSIDQAQNEMIDIEHLSDDELQKLADKYQKVREECDSRSRRRKQES
jgi:Low affinity iron permease